MNPVSPPAVWPYDPSDRVMLGWKGLVVGILVSHLVFGVFLALSDPLWGTALFIFSAPPTWGVAAAVGSLLGLALRRVRNQWIHIAAFFAAGALICVPFGGFWNSQSWAYPLSIAVAAGIARLSIWKLVRINDQPSIS
ncbi:hypothetical protein [Arthrobacter sp. 18067]|uniref:hypothetical protein n=1 Tax=Arthrobacter sp. 18067 TaxID=2681413 RepID=UPI00135B7E25|nr:hypothetical protein [Arthrobacter sp. 18067]